MKDSSNKRRQIQIIIKKHTVIVKLAKLAQLSSSVVHLKKTIENFEKAKFKDHEFGRQPTDGQQQRAGGDTTFSFGGRSRTEPSRRGLEVETDGLHR